MTIEVLKKNGNMDFIETEKFSIMNDRVAYLDRITMSTKYIIMYDKNKPNESISEIVLHTGNGTFVKVFPKIERGHVFGVSENIGNSKPTAKRGRPAGTKTNTKSTKKV